MILLYQGQAEYPSLHIQVTDNIRYSEGKLRAVSVEDALAKIEKWLRSKEHAK